MNPIPRCSDCGDKAIATYAVDGTNAALCFACIRESIVIGERHAILQRVHDYAHNHVGPGCPVCRRELAERSIMWGEP